MSDQMCPQCGDRFPHDLLLHGSLIPVHRVAWPKCCPGSGQIPRCAESDARPLWNGEPNPHFAG